MKMIDDEEEIMKRLLDLPKWRIDKDYSKIISRCMRRVKSPLEKSISTIKAAVLIPLSPVQIYKVYIYPTTFAFGMVSDPKYDTVIYEIAKSISNKKSQDFLQKLIIIFYFSERGMIYKS